MKKGRNFEPEKVEVELFEYEDESGGVYLTGCLLTIDEINRFSFEEQSRGFMKIWKAIVNKRYFFFNLLNVIHMLTQNQSTDVPFYFTIRHRYIYGV